MSAQSQTSKNVPGTIKPRLRGIQALLTHHTFRRLSQLFFAGFILFVTLRHVIIGEDSGIITASPEAYCPLGGLETLYKYLTTGGAFVSHTHLSNVVVLVATVAVSVLTRNAFCGWVCPLGFIQEMISSFSAFLQKKLPFLRRWMASLRKPRRLWSVLDRYLRFVKYGVLAWAVGGSAYFGYMVFRDVDPWSALISIAEFSFTPGLVVLIVTLLASFFVERPWCRYTCPLGAATGLLGKLSPFYLKREDSTCKACAICTKACPMGLNVHEPDVMKKADCISCLECVGACPRNGALEVKLGLPIIGK